MALFAREVCVARRVLVARSANRCRLGGLRSSKATRMICRDDGHCQRAEQPEEDCHVLTDGEWSLVRHDESERQRQVRVNAVARPGRQAASRGSFPSMTGDISQSPWTPEARRAAVSRPSVRPERWGYVAPDIASTSMLPQTTSYEVVSKGAKRTVNCPRPLSNECWAPAAGQRGGCDRK